MKFVRGFVKGRAPDWRQHGCGEFLPRFRVDHLHLAALLDQLHQLVQREVLATRDVVESRGLEYLRMTIVPSGA